MKSFKDLGLSDSLAKACEIMFCTNHFLSLDSGKDPLNL